MLLTSGGISMGQYDLVPDVLEELGVEIRLRKVRVKPGKPTIFGVWGGRHLVFALPGNPGSCFIGMWLMVWPMLAAMEGAELRFPTTVAVRARQDLKPGGERQSYVPSWVEIDAQGQAWCAPVRWHSSGDPFGLARANGLVVRPIDAPAVPAGAPVPVIPLGSWTAG